MHETLGEAGRRTACERAPREHECRALLARHGALPAAVSHAVVVAAVAARLAAAHQAAGVRVDVQLLKAAALLHDVSRGVPGHAAAGAAVLEDEGLSRVAAVVRHHVQLPGSSPPVPGETEILLLADVPTVGSEVVGLPANQRRAEELSAGDGAALAEAAARLAGAHVVGRAQVVGDGVEALVGRRLAEVLRLMDVERSGSG